MSEIGIGAKTAIPEFVALTPSGEPMPWTKSYNRWETWRKVSRYWWLAEQAGYRVVWTGPEVVA